MLPISYQLPFAVILVLGGAVSCFYGYRWFRMVLAIGGFIIGAFLASSVFGASDRAWMVGAALAGGLLGAALLYAAYFVGVALFGAGLGVVLANLTLSAVGQEPHFLVVVLAAVAGAVASMYLQRYVIIVSTAFAGAWTLIVGVMALLGNRPAITAGEAREIWVVYPLDPAPGQGWVPIAWMVLGAVGTAVQLGWTGGDKGRIGRRVGKRRKT
jgi:hypothetical protein